VIIRYKNQTVKWPYEPKVIQYVVVVAAAVDGHRQSTCSERLSPNNRSFIFVVGYQASHERIQTTGSLDEGGGVIKNPLKSFSVSFLFICSFLDNELSSFVFHCSLFKISLLNKSVFYIKFSFLIMKTFAPTNVS